MEPIAQFQAIYERMSTDRDGETKFTVTIPLSDLPAILKAALIIGETVRVTIERIPK